MLLARNQSDRLLAKHEDRDLHVADNIPVAHVHDPDDPSMVHWNNSRHGSILRNAPCKFLRVVELLPVLMAVQIVTRGLLDKSNYTDSVTASPYFAGIISASMVWVGYAWVTRLLHRK